MDSSSQHELDLEKVYLYSFMMNRDGIVILDPSLNIVMVNWTIDKRYSDQLPLVGKKCYQAFKYSSAPCEQCLSQQAMQTGKTYARRRPFLQNGQQTGWLEVEAHPIINQQGEVLGAIEFIRDLTEEVDLKQAVTLSEDKYQLLIEQSAEMIYLHDLEGCIFEVNRAAERWTGYTREELIEMNIFDLHPSQEGRENVVAEWKSWRPGVDQVTLEFEHRRKDGTTAPVEISTGKVLIGDQELILALARDVSERREAARIIEESRDWYRALAEDIPALITRVSPVGKVTYVNPASAEIIGLPPDKIIGRDFYDLVPEQYRFQIEKAFSSLTPDAPLISYEHANRGRLFKWKNRAVYNEQGELKEYFTVGEDITESRAAEERLRESEMRNRALINALPDLICCFNSQGEILDAIVKYEEHLTEQGEYLYRKGLLVGANIQDLLDQEPARLIATGITKVLESGQLYVLEYLNEIRGKRCYQEARIVRLGPDEAMAIIRDITHRKLAEQSLQQQLLFEQAVADISSVFVNAPSGSINQAINYALRRSGELFEADRSYVFRFDNDQKYMSILHEWCADGVTSQIDRNQHYPVERTPWWFEQLKNKEYVLIDDVDLLPPEADRDKIDFLTEEIKSLLTLPLVREGKIIGFFGFDAVKEKKTWSAQQISLLNVIAEIIAGALVGYEARVALQESEERYREILATIEEGYYETDLTGRLTYINEAACQLFGGYEPEELLGMSYDQLYQDPARAFKTFNKVFTTGKPERGLILEMIRKDGAIRFGELSISLIRNRDGRVTGFKGIGKDVTDRIEYERKLEYLSLHDQLTGIYNRAYFESELERLSGSREFPVTIISADLDGLKLINDTIGHNAGDHLLQNCALVMKESLRQSDILARVGGDEFSVILPRTDKPTGENIVRRMREKINNYNMNNEDLLLGISLGVATAENSEETLKTLFKRADDMMYRDKLYRSSSSRGKIVQSLLAALAERDYITEGHARRLEDLCRAIGEKLNLSSHQLADLALLAQVHDLGKVGIPDHILFKPDRLTDDEWEIMKGHPEKGYRIASSSPDLAGIAEFILKHHERWDGSGYPLGLQGEEIPIECRILAIVDAFDAMTNKRPYNDKKTVEEATEELNEYSGSQFDPELVRVFLDVLEDEKQ